MWAKNDSLGLIAQLIVIVISELLERHSKAKRTWAPAYSRALRRIKGVVQRVAHGKQLLNESVTKLLSQSVDHSVTLIDTLKSPKRLRETIFCSNYALNHLREDMEFVGYFKETKLERSCDVCHELYGISKGDCMTVEHDASGLCFEKSARDRSHFKSKWHELVSEESPKASPADSERYERLQSDVIAAIVNKAIVKLF